MRSETQSLLKQICSRDLFWAVGTSWEPEVAAHQQSWQEAIASCEADDWFQLTDQAPNLLSVQLASSFPQQYEAWNIVAQHVKDRLKDFLSAQIERVSGQTPECDLTIFSGCVEWDLIHACIEVEYDNLVHVGFFTELARWYLCGRFPCGWVGTFPSGGIVIF